MPTTQSTPVQIQALTGHYPSINNRIITPVELKNVLTQQVLQTTGLWDTGATNSVVTKSAAKALGLRAITRAIARGVHGKKRVNVYYVNITLNKTNITLNARVTECEELSFDNSVGLLIGMDIITMGDFAVTNYQGKTVMSFRVPSVQKIDFMETFEDWR
ncbi:MAG: aspartyl protease family protein [Prevotellaceae bacterium]|jgi:predicted aspartyl protease|nr:aspartyl protease family protein [Prevotellaceae bacterium]